MNLYILISTMTLARTLTTYCSEEKQVSIFHFSVFRYIIMNSWSK